MRKAIIGGTGVYSLVDRNADGNAKSAHETGVGSAGANGKSATKGFNEAIDGYSARSIETQTIKTDFGDVQVDILNTDKGEVVFLARHGKDHSLPPHQINYRANMMALKLLDVDEILATCAVGSMREQYAIGDVVILKDFIDFTKSRVQTFYDGSDGNVCHVVMGKPYCPALSEEIAAKAKSREMKVSGSAVYVCTEGPRFETAAEIRMFSQLGGDVVGMTNVPECVLAKELGMCYAAVGIVSNWCTGIKFDEIAIHDIEAAMAKNKKLVTETFLSVLLDQDRIRRRKTCNCADSLIRLYFNKEQNKLLKNEGLLH
jgi:5'-methylthioadenosine phosphorylase